MVLLQIAFIEPLVAKIIARKEMVFCPKESKYCISLSQPIHKKFA
jgi:hypothetical protein